MRIREGPQRPRTVFRHREIAVEFARPGKGRAPGPRFLLGRVRVASTCGECTQNSKVRLVDESILVHVNPPYYLVGRGEWITEKHLQTVDVSGGPSPIAVQITQHDQFGANFHSVDWDSELPIRISARRHDADGQENPSRYSHTQPPLVRNFRPTSAKPVRRRTVKHRDRISSHLSILGGLEPQKWSDSGDRGQKVAISSIRN